MAVTSTWRVKDGCRKCKSPVYYYPAKLVLEFKGLNELLTTDKVRIVSCSCTGENENSKHLLDYKFPNDFEKIE